MEKNPYYAIFYVVDIIGKIYDVIYCYPYIDPFPLKSLCKWKIF